MVTNPVLLRLRCWCPISGSDPASWTDVPARRPWVNILAISTSISTVNCIIDLAGSKDAYAAVCEQFDVP